MLKSKWSSVSLALLALFYVASTQATVREGFYLGGGVGGNISRFEMKVTNTVNSFAVTPPSQSETDLLGTVFAGFGGSGSAGFYLAGEVSTYFPSRSTTFRNRPGVTLTTSTFSNTAKVQDYVTLDLLPGYRLNDDWLIYLRGGISYEKISLGQPTSGSVAGFSANEKKLSPRLGIGANYGFSENFGVGLDYVYTIYPNTSYTYAAYNARFRESISSQYIGLTAIYTFG